MGMKNTRFQNPHGLDDHENHYSTAYDMAILTKYAMKLKDYQKISGTKIYIHFAGFDGEDGGHNFCDARDPPFLMLILGI